MQLYRFMAAVTAGPEQAQCVDGQRGVVTIWVRADSESAALSRAEQAVNARRYSSRGELTGFLEEQASHSTTRTTLDEAETQSAGYETIKQNALDRGDGLFELWMPEPGNDAESREA